MFQTTRRFAVGFALISAAALAGSAAAHEVRETVGPPPVVIRFGGLDLNTREGAGILYRKILTAAQQACGPAFAVWYPQKWAQWQACYRSTVDRTVREVNRPLLTAIHEEKLGKPRVEASASAAH